MAVAAKTADPKVWENTVAGDPHSVISRLRAAGFPPYVIRTIVTALVSEPFKRKRGDIAANATLRPYWKYGAWGGMLDPKSQAAWEASVQDQRAAVKAATEELGKDDDDPMNAILNHARFGDLPQTAIDQVSKIHDDYSQMMAEIYRKAQGTLLPEDHEKLAYLQREQEADLAKTLTPDQYETYELHFSDTAQRLQGKLTAFDASEAEYKAIFDAQRKVDVRFADRLSGNRAGPLSQDEIDQQAAAQRDADAEIAAALGPSRYADYKAETDPAYVQTNQIVQRLNLAPETTGKLVDLHKSIQAQASAIRSNASLSKTEMASELSGLANQAATQLDGLLGPSGSKAYTGTAGYWLNALKVQGP